MEYSSHYVDQSRLAMTTGAMAERVIIALAKYQAGKSLDATDLTALQSGKELLEGAKSGFAWSDNPQISEESIKSACSFDLAASAWTPMRSPEDFVSDIDDMIGATAAAITDRRTADSSFIVELSHFFERLFRRSIDTFAQSDQIPGAPDLV